MYNRPLKQGVKVVAAHYGSLGKSIDFEETDRKKQNFELFMRLFDDPRYERYLFTDLAAAGQWNRIGTPLTTMLDRSDLHHRIGNL